MDDYDDCDNGMANYIQAVVMSFVDYAVLLVPSRRRVGIFKRRWEDTTVVLDNYNDTIYRFENTGYTIVQKYPASRWVV